MGQKTNINHNKVIKKSAQILGYAGATPFIGLGFLLMFAGKQFTPFIASALLFYGAIILSFLGGLHWGRIASSQHNQANEKWILIYSVIPALIGWASVLLYPIWGGVIWLQISGFIFAYIMDVHLLKSSIWQQWMPKLRFHLTLAASLSLIILAVS